MQETALPLKIALGVGGGHGETRASRGEREKEKLLSNCLKYLLLFPVPTFQV